MAKATEDSLLARLAESVSDAEDLEALTRPMLQMLETMTGLESTYLTTVDEAAGFQKILYSRNTGTMQIPEGLEVPWGDTLCKRALEEGRAFTDDVASCWGDSDAAKALGINTYMSQPVRTLDGQLYGTLCAASSKKAAVPESVLGVFTMFAKLIAQQVDRERMLSNARRENKALQEAALTDPLTGLANRRAMEKALSKMLARAARDGGQVQVAFVDLDGFKGINDTHGHDCGDRFLIHIARKLTASMREGDVVCRTGGDEFVVLAPGEKGGELQQRLEQATIGPFEHGPCTLDYRGASVGVAASAAGDTDADALLKRADAAMYEAKKRRKAAR